MNLSVRDRMNKGGEKSDEFSGRMNMNEFLLLSFLLVLGHPIYLCEKSVIPAHTHIGPWMNKGPELTDQDASRPDGLPVKDLDASSLARAVTSVSRASCSFFMCHLVSRLLRCQLGLVRLP